MTDHTLTLPSETKTMTLPSQTRTNSMTLPSETHTTSMPSATSTSIKTVTLPSAAKSATSTFSMRSGTETGTETETVQATDTSSNTFTMPTKTSTHSSSLTLPTATSSASLTGTATLPAHDNYTNALEPSSFYAGQEIRIQLKATLDPFHDPKTARYPELFNVSAMGSLQVQVFKWDSTKAGDCAQYVAGGNPLYKTGEFGMTMVERYEGHVFVGAAHVTFAAPHSATQFVVCFKHTVPMYRYNSDAVTNKWMLFSTTDVSSGIVGQYVFQAQPSKMFYYLPDPSSGQYAIVQLLSQENWNFTYAPSSCGSSNSEEDAMSCGFGDNLKLVPAGEPCTLEHQAFNLPYLGSAWVQNDGTWDRSAVHGLRLGSTAGGAGRFGTQYANPLVDTWTSWGTYFPANSEAHIYSHTTTSTTSVLSRDDYLLNYPHHAYVYLRLPQTPEVHYDICFSSREQRISWLSGNNTLDAVPMWRKVYKCANPSSCSAGLESDGGRSFKVTPENVGWTMYDLTPNTWGTIVFNDNSGMLSNEAATSTILVNAPVATEAYPVAPGAASGTNNANYWAPPGGDYFRIVKASRFGESTSMSNGLGLGSFPNTGCWDRSLDDAGTGTQISYPSTPSPQQGGWVSDGAEYPIGSRDLTGDPTIAAPSDDSPDQKETYATLWVPNVMSRWYVCYRRTCGSTSKSECTKNSGMRVLPWHDSSFLLSETMVSVVPVKFLHLERAYTPGYGMGLMAAPLVPFTYGEDEFEYPPAVSWYMNDTREYSYGPLIIEKSNYTEMAKLDSRPWNGVREWIKTGCDTAVQNSNFGYRTCSPTGLFSCDQLQCTEGSALRLVRENKPCDWPGFIGSTTQGASVTDGGAVECNSKDAITDGVYCQGRRANSMAVSTVAFYITVPERVAERSGYRVCYRLHGWNWREVWPTPTDAKAWGDATQPQIARQRGDWVVPNLGQTDSTSPSNNGVDNWFLPTKDARSSLSLTAVEDRAGMEALFIISDTRNEVSVAPRLSCPGGCDASGDVLRLVQEDQTCDVYPNTIDNNGWDQEKADDHLSLYCPQPGSSVVGNSGLSTQLACQTAKNTKALCKGEKCESTLPDKTTYKSGEADKFMLTRLLISTPEIYDDIVPGDSVYYNYGHAAGVIELPTYSSTTSQNRYKVCYKQMGTANWVIFNDTWEVQPNPGLVASLSLLDAGQWTNTRDLKDGVDLIGGELQRFTLRFPKPVATSSNISVRPSGISALYAKLVKITGDENGCLNPAGSTEAAVFGSQTTTFQVAEGDDLSAIEFYIITPHEPGQYDLCIQTRMTAEDSMSWWRGKRVDGSSQRVTVHDNGVRYYVTPGNQPTNQAQTIVSFIRCTAPMPPNGAQAVQPQDAPKACDFLSNQDVFNTNPGADSAKIVAVNHPCSDGDGRRAGWGSSAHVGIGDVVSPAQDSTDDLGPGDGQVDVAELTVTLPAVTADDPTTYKVCVFSSFSDFAGGSRKTWVEVSQAINVPGQLVIRDTDTNRPNFHTDKAHVDHWELDSRLAPEFNLYSSAHQTDAIGGGSTAIGGASTTYVAKDSLKEDTTETQVGFKITTYSLDQAEGRYFSETDNLFKLVKVAAPKSRVPASAVGQGTWGQVDQWDRLMDASCFSPGHFSANNIDACLAPESSLTGGAKCPHLQIGEGGTGGSGIVLVQGHFTVPLEPGKYVVCYKLNSTDLTAPQPWLLVRSKDAKDASIKQSGFFYSHPSFLEFESSTPVTTDSVTSTTNMTVHDLRVTYNSTAEQIVPLSSWCARVPEEVWGQGAPCMSENGAIPVDKTTRYPADLVTIINSSQVCPTPTSGPDGMGSTGAHVWWSLLRTRNSSVMVNASDVHPFSLPPSKLSVSGQYKICVFKAGEAKYGDYAPDFVTKKGLVYQVFNRGTATTGGNTGLWRDSVTGVPAKLLVTPLLGFNSSVRFIEYQGADTRAMYDDLMVPSEVVASPVTGTVSRTPLLRSGSTVDFVVRAATSSENDIPSGEYAVDVYRCSSPQNWDALACPLSNAKGPSAAVAPFSLMNVNGDCPSDSHAGRYGWPQNGLRQFLTSGTVRFSLQYLSACNDNVWGCGVRFAAMPTGSTTQITSYPQWVNVEEKNYADSVQLGPSHGETLTEVDPHVAPQAPGCAPDRPTNSCPCVPPGCYMMKCIHMQACDLAIRARFQGPPEYAAFGRVTVRYSKLDYTSLTNEFSAPAQLTSVVSGITTTARTGTAWGKGGEILYSITLPRINMPAENRAFAFLNVTWEGDAAASTSFRDWTRVVVEVVRPEPGMLRPVRLLALDVDVPALIREREPSPRFRSLTEGTHLQADGGNYIDALVPYELRYTIGMANFMGGYRGFDGEITPAIGLMGWKLSASFESTADEVEKNRVLEVLQDSTGLPVAENMETLPAHTARVFGKTDVSWDPANDDNGWFLRFRVLNNIGCSRFKGGCTIKFHFTKGTTAGPSMTVTTPVRVIGTTTKVTTWDVTTSASTMTAPTWDGIRVRVLAGTPCGTGCFLYDEYHFGDFFALWLGPHAHDGLETQDEVYFTNPGTGVCAMMQGDHCVLPTSSPHVLQVGPEEYWGAEWTITTNMPCHMCSLSFHTLSGAGPDDYETPGTGTTSIILSQGSMDLACAGTDTTTKTVTWITNKQTSEMFSVMVTAARADDLTTSAIWPRWIVHVAGDSTNAYALNRDGDMQELMSDAATTFTELAFSTVSSEQAAPAAPVTVIVNFHTEAPNYDSTVVGTVALTTTSHSCKAEVTLDPVQPTPVPSEPLEKYVRITSVGRATPRCAEVDGCDQWQATTTQMVQTGSRGIQANLRFFTSDGNPDSTLRNVTVVTPDNTQLPFTKDVSTGEWVASTPVGDPLKSFANASTPPAEEVRAVDSVPRTWTYGYLALGFKRTLVSEVSGDASVIMFYDTTQGIGNEFPARDARMSLCGTLWTDGTEELELTLVGAPLCATLRLWVVPEAVSRKVYIWDYSNSGTTPAEVNAGLPVDASGAPRCAPEAGTLLSFQVRTFYELPSVTAAAAHVFIVYDRAIEYTLSIGTGATQQRLVSQQMLASANKTITLATATGQYEQSFSVYGLDTIATAQAARVTAVDLSDTTGQASSITATSTATEYIFITAVEHYATFNILEKLQYDDECQSKRLLMVKPEAGYRMYAPGHPPGAGWGYADVPAAVGLPFPIQTVVEIAGAGRGALLDKRAWTFASDNANMPGRSMLSVTKHSWAGCNDGGVMSTHQLIPSEATDVIKVLPGELSKSFNSPAHVLTNQGVGSAWVKFDQQCEACTVRVQLCYMGATSDADCLLAPNEALASDVEPLLADRTKVSRAFSVRDPVPHQLQVWRQSVPLGQKAYVGQGFSVELEAVQLFDDWAFRLPTDTTASITADTIWACSGTCLTSTQVRYGNGGFLQAPATQQDLSVRLAATGRCEQVNDLSSASMFPISDRFTTHQTTVSATDGVKVSFYFTRPCSQCRIAIGYTNLGHERHMGAVTLRQYSSYSTTPEWLQTGAWLSYKVEACASKWAWAGRKASPAVRKNKVWSVSAWRTDSNLFPVWTGVDRITATAQTEGNSYGGNGHGGEWMLSSPGTSTETGSFSTAAVNGTATFRMSASRACYKCAVTLRGGGSILTRDLAVLTDATQIVVIPPPGQDSIVVWPEQNDSNDPSFVNSIKANFVMEAYAADELGDRAYTASGPTIQAYQPLWSVHNRAVGKLEVEGPGSTGSTLAGKDIDTRPSKVMPVVNSVGTEVITTVSDGTPDSIAVTNGSLAYNGIPFPELSYPGDTLMPGFALIQVTGTGSFIPIKLRIAPGATDSSIRTTEYGEKKDVVVAHTVEATHMAVENAAELGCQNGVEDMRCTIDVYAVGHRPGFPKPEFQLANLYEGEEVMAAGWCDNVDPNLAKLCDISVDMKQKFDMGVATFSVHFASASSSETAPDCTCYVDFTGPEGLAERTQTVSLTFTKSTWEPKKFMWTGSRTLNPPTGGGRDVTTVINRTVTLTLHAVNDQGEGGPSVVDWGSTPTSDFTLLTDSMDPPGCFRPDGYSIDSSRTTVEITGHFHSTATNGLCTIQASAAASSLPLPLNEDLRATPQIPKTISVVMVAGTTGEMRDRGRAGPHFMFDGLVARTGGPDGKPAAIANKGATITFEVKNAEGEVCSGDYHTVIELSEADSGSAPKKRVTAGVVTFEILRAPETMDRERGGSTRKRDGEGHKGLDHTASGAADLAVGGSWVPTAIDNIEPLYFIREAKRLDVHALFYSGHAEEAIYLLPNVHDMDLINDGKLEREANKMLMTTGEERKESPAAQMARMYENASSEVVFWVRGYPFDLMISAVDDERKPIHHDEDLGSGAFVELRGVGIPCIDADTSVQNGLWVKSTCISSSPACQAMKFTTLPRCGTGGWKAGKQGMERGLVGQISQGALSLTDVRYEGERYEVRFTVSVVSGWKSDYIFLGQMTIQRLHMMCPLDSEGKCTECVPHPDEARAEDEYICQLPPFPNNELIRTDELELDIGIVDDLHRIVMAESTADVSVTGMCQDSPTFMSQVGSEDLFTPPKFPATNGVVKVNALQFDGACGNFTLTFQALPRRWNSEWEDTFAQVARLPSFTTTPFTILGLATDTPAPPPACIPPPPITVDFNLKEFTPAPPAGVLSQLTQFGESVGDAREFDKAMTIVTKSASGYITKTALQRICAIAKTHTDGKSIPDECKQGSAKTLDPEEAALYGCACYGFNGVNSSEVFAGAPTEEVATYAKAQVDVSLHPAAGCRYNDNPDAVAELSNTIFKAIRDDLLAGGTSVLKTQAAAAFAEADPADLGFVDGIKITPAPPGGANTPKPTVSPTQFPTPTPPPTQPPTVVPPPPPTADPTVATAPPTSPVTPPPFIPSSSSRTVVSLVFAVVLAFISWAV